MPAPELWGKFQDAVLWEVTGYDEYGQPTVSETSTQIRVRWDDTYRQVAGKDGTPVEIVATVAVNRDLQNGSLLWKGREADLPTNGVIPDVLEVHQVDIVPDLKVRVSYREYQLKRSKDKINTTTADT